MKLFVPQDMPAPPRSVIELPELKVYIENFGKFSSDIAFAAEAEGKIVGAWCRIMADYGHWAKDIPSLAMAVLPAQRGKGIDSQLLHRLLQRLQALGCRGLSVSGQNPAERLYHRMGFKMVLERKDNFVMLHLFHHSGK